MADSIEKILKIGVSYKDAIKGLADYERQIAATTEREKELKKAIADGSATQAEEMEFQKLKLQHKQLSDEKRNLMKEINNQMKLQKEEEGSLNSLKVKAGELKKQIDSLSEADRNNANIGGKLIQQRREIIEKLKAEEKAYGDTQRNVGNYEEDIRKALGANTKLGQVVTSVTGAIKAEGGVTTLKLICAGGVLPLRVRGASESEGVEIHSVFGQSAPNAKGEYSMYNTGAGPTAPETEFTVAGTYTTPEQIKNIIIEVKKNDIWMPLNATRGEAACKILVDSSFKPVRERRNIADENKKFTDYVQGTFLDDFWWK
jgi:hypothetical protein